MSKQKRLRALEQHPHSSVLDWCVFNRYVFVFKHTQMLYREMYTLMLLTEKTMLALIDQWHTKEQKTTKHTHSTIHPQTEVSLNKRTTHLAKNLKCENFSFSHALVFISMFSFTPGMLLWLLFSVSVCVNTFLPDIIGLTDLYFSSNCVVNREKTHFLYFEIDILKAYISIL